MPERDEEFRGKVVVITGAAGVIGSWITRSFATSGARLCLSDSRGDRLETLAAETRDSAQDCVTHVTELLDADSINDLVQTTQETLGVPDIVINNAGVYPSSFLLDTTVAEWDRILGVNLRAPFLVATGFAREMARAKKPGCIINISSAAARSMRATAVPYCVSKTGEDRLTKGLAIELARYGIRVNAVEPGFAPGSDFSVLTDAHVASASAQVPLGRKISPDDTPAAIKFLCSSGATFVTGATLSVDGGLSAGSLTVYQDKKEPSL